MTKFEIIKDTVEYYFKNPRAINPDVVPSCFLRSKDGAYCAVGRTIDPSTPIGEKLLIPGGSSETPYGLFKTYQEEEFMKPEYRGHEFGFWEELQKLHDRSVCWDSKRDGGNMLTDAGKHRVTQIVASYYPLDKQSDEIKQWLKSL